MNNLDIAKTGVGIVVGTGVGKIVKGIIANNIAHPEKTTEKVFIYAGAVVLGMMAKDASKDYTSTKIDGYAKLIKKIRTKVEEAKEAPTE